MFSPFRAIVLAVLALAALTDAANTSKVYVKNSKQAAALQAAAVKLKPGNYRIQNVKTGQSLYYVPKGNHIYPQKGKYTKAAVTTYANKAAPWHRLNFGSKKKCISSAWGTGGNNAAVMYACASGKGATKTTLEKTKQWWLMIPVSKPLVAAKSNSAANKVLLAAQADSIATREKKIAAQKAAFGKRDLHGRDVEDAQRHGRMMRTVRKRAIEKRANKTVSGGTFYILAVDHLLDRAAALTGKAVVSRKIKSTVIKTWKKGDKSQMWKVTRV